MVRLSFDAWKEGKVSPATVEIPTRFLEVKPSPQLRATLNAHKDGALNVLFSPHGKTPVLQESVRDAKTRRSQTITGLWDLTTGKPRALVPGEDSLLGISPDGKTLARSGEKGGVLWDVASAKARATLTEKEEYLGQ